MLHTGGTLPAIGTAHADMIEPDARFVDSPRERFDFTGSRIGASARGER
jgi:hypothetical protein